MFTPGNGYWRGRDTFSRSMRMTRNNQDNKEDNDDRILGERGGLEDYEMAERNKEGETDVEDMRRTRRTRMIRQM